MKLGAATTVNLIWWLSRPAVLQTMPRELVVLTAETPENYKLVNDLGVIFNNAFLQSGGKSALHPINPPDDEHDLDASKLKGDGHPGVIIHGDGQARDFLMSQLATCFLVRQTSQRPAGLLEYWKRTDPSLAAINDYVWIEIGPGDPWKPGSHCED